MRGLGRRSRIGRRSATALLLSTVLAASPVRAEERGFFEFLSSLGSGSPPPAPPTAVSPSEPLRPLTVRPVRRKRPAAARAAFGRPKVTSVPGPTGPVSIYRDRTLRDGDAVMTKDGMRVFAGSRSSPDKPYTDANFIALPAAKTVGPALRKTLTEINKLPQP